MLNTPISVAVVADLLSGHTRALPASSASIPPRGGPGTSPDDVAQQRSVPFMQLFDRYEVRYHNVQLPLPIPLVWRWRSSGAFRKPRRA